MHDLTLLNQRRWENIQPLLPPRAGFGRPRADDRMVLEGILWVLRSGARWRDLPTRYPSASTCWRRLRDWEEEEVWLNIWRLFLCELDARGRLNWDEVFMDGSFAPAKKGGSAWVKPNVAKVRSGWWWQTARVYLWEVDSLAPRLRKSSSQKNLERGPGATRRSRSSSHPPRAAHLRPCL